VRIAFEIRHASALYDFELSLRDDCDSDVLLGGLCEAPGDLLIRQKAGGAPLQHLKLEHVDVAIDARGEPLVNSSALYDDQGTLQVGDFNFDGHEDLAVQDSEQGPSGGPTFDVFLFDPKTDQFVPSEALSELTRTTLGFFRVDPEHKRLTTLAKSGCCYHVTEQYRVAHGEPVLVSRVTEDAQGEHDIVETTERLAGARWATTTRHVPREPPGQ
jgi:hypothetical protein